MKRVAIERKKNLSAADFARDHLEGAGKPVIITDATEHWPARRKWTFNHFKTTYGADYVTAPLELFSKVAKLTKLATYIDYLDAPTEELPGFWVDARTQKPLLTPPPEHSSRHYLTRWDAFPRHPELYDDLKPHPYFVSDWVTIIDPTLRSLFEWTSRRNYWTVYIGPEDSFSQLHQDYWHTHAYLALIQGRKQAILFSPDDSALLYGGRVNPEQPDLERFERFDQVTAYECVIEPGELLFMPAGWWHQVRGLEKSITVSHNFFNHVNFNEHWTELLRKLPRLVRGLDQTPAWKEALGVEWRSTDFADPGS